MSLFLPCLFHSVGANTILPSWPSAVPVADVLGPTVLRLASELITSLRLNRRRRPQDKITAAAAALYAIRASRNCKHSHGDDDYAAANSESRLYLPVSSYCVRATLAASSPNVILLLAYCCFKIKIVIIIIIIQHIVLYGWERCVISFLLSADNCYHGLMLRD